MEDADLFMECEEEELEPWQQMDQDEKHDSPDTAKKLATPTVAKTLVIPCIPTTSTKVSTVSLLSNTAVPAGISKPGQPLILTQGAGGLTPVALSQVFLPSTVPVSSASGSQPIYLTTQAIPVQNVQSGQSPVSIVLNVQQGQTVRPITLVQAPGAPGIFRPAVGTTQLITQQLQTRPTTQVVNRTQVPASFTTMQIPTTITIKSTTPTSLPRATAVPSVPVTQGSTLSKVLPINNQTKIVVKSGTSSLDIQNLMSIVNHVNRPTGGQPQTIVVMSSQKADGAGSTDAVQTVLPPAQSNVVQVSSITPSSHSCPRCGAQFKMIEALRGHMCFCCPDLSQTTTVTSNVPAHSEQEPQNMNTEDNNLSLNVKSENMDTNLGEHQSRIVMLVDDFYYGTYEGNRSYVPTDTLKEPLSFRCLTCGKKLKNNIRLMKHLKAHVNEEQQTGEMVSHTSCPHCYRQFPTPFRLQCHVESVHSAVQSITSCKICEWGFESEPVFLQHMKNTHKPGEMPYVCQVCKYRSSFYSDVHNHFCTWHEDTRYLLCIYCLKVFKNPTNYQQHFSRHQKGSVYHCNKCRLQFLFTKEKAEHKVNHHKTFRKPSQLEGLLAGTKVTIRAYPGKKMASYTGFKASKKPSTIDRKTVTAQPSQPSLMHTHSTNDQKPAVQQSTGTGKKQITKMYNFLVKFQEQRALWGRQKCVECTFDIPDFANHFPTYVHCSLCTYSTCCSRAYANHMINHVSGRVRTRRSKKSSLSWIELTCSHCYYNTNQGDLMAKHLAQFPSHQYSVFSMKECLETDIEFYPVEEEKVGASNEAKSEWLSMEHWKVPSDEGSVPEFTDSCGPQHLIPKSSDVLEYFQLLFPDALIDQIVKETNLYVEYQKSVDKGGTKWLPLTNEEVKGFIGLSILMGLQVLPDPEMYWSFDHYNNCSAFYRTMSAARFKQISINIRMNSMLKKGGQHNADKLSFFQNMLKILETGMLRAYKPNKCLTIDRTILKAHEVGADEEKSRNSTPQIWLLCDSKSGYCHKLLILTKHEKGKDLGRLVVPHLLKGLENKNHQVFISSLLTSVPLMKELHKVNIYCSSSVLPSSPALPEEFWNQATLKNTGDFVQFEHPPALVTKWKDAKEMFCLSTNAVAGNPDKVWRRSTVKAGELSTISRPLAFKLLQDNMRGVDICSQLLACNQLGGLVLDTNWRCLFWFLVNLSIINSFIILREMRKSSPPGWLHGGHFSQAAYRKRLGFQLAKCAERHALQKQVTDEQKHHKRNEGRKELFDTSEGVKHRLAKISIRTRRCKSCNVTQQRHESVYGCIACQVNLCRHTRCFWDYHGFSANYKGNPRTGFVEPKREQVHSVVDSSLSKRFSHGSEMEVSTTSLADSSELNQEYDKEMAPLETSDSELDTDDSAQEEPEYELKDRKPTKPNSPKTMTENEEALSVRQLRTLLLALCSGIQKAAKDMNIEPQLIRTWLKDRERRLECEDLGKSESSGEAVEHLVEWVLDQREQQHPVAERNLFQKASEIHTETNKTSSFRISYDWAVNFMLEHKLGLENVGMSGRQLPPIMEKNCLDFTEFVQRQIKMHNMSVSAVGAMDEFSVFVDFDKLIESNDTSKDEAFKFEGTGKPWINIYFSVLADGTVLPAMLFFKGPRLENFTQGLSDLVLLEAKVEGFSEKEELQIWTAKVWQQRSQDEKKMLIIDAHHNHMSEDFLSNLSGTQTLPSVLPFGCATKQQPLEKCVFPVLKKFLLNRWSHLVAQGKAAGIKSEDLVLLLITWLKEALAACSGKPKLIQDSFCLTQVIIERGESEKANSQGDLVNSLTEAMFRPEAVDSDLLSEETPVGKHTESILKENANKMNEELYTMDNVKQTAREIVKETEDKSRTEASPVETKTEKTVEG
ncbi:pogo transposable element with ZNF domain isoform X2 [Trichomycterus rosablanca]|uniref:pogo transposable element with ZNF domain isoform X2 n=1 Tax=Trichomycterus rosablanca TaxID=2290929 RepID=UPI002F35F2E3